MVRAMVKHRSALFRGRHFPDEIILLCLISACGARNLMKTAAPVFSTLRAVVSSVFAQLPRPGRNHDGAGPERGPFHHRPLGSTLCPRSERALAAACPPTNRLLESRRNLYSSQRPVDISV